MVYPKNCQEAKPENLKSINRSHVSGTIRQSRKLFSTFVLMATCAASILAPRLMAITESKKTTTTTLGASATKIEYGAKLTLMAKVSPSSATGTVTFYSGTKAIGKSALSGGSVKFSLSSLAVGSDEVKAVYSGSSTDASSTSKSVSVDVKEAQTKTVLSSSGSGAHVTFTAKVSPSGATGRVLFLEGPTGNGIQLGTVTLVGGVAKLSHLPQGLPTGNQAFSAVYLGTSDWEFSTSNTLHVTVE